MSPNLTPKQRRFVEQYLVDLNATQAATRAGYSAKTAKSQGQRLLKHPPVAALIADQRREISERTNIRVCRAIEEIAHSAFVDIADAYDENNCLRDTDEIPEPVRRAIVSIETEEIYEGSGEERRLVGYTKRVKFSNKLKALELLGKHLGMFDPQRAANDGPVQIIVQSNVSGAPASLIPGRVDPDRFDPQATTRVATRRVGA